jgi:UDP-N-acetyl-2-amino-2-deoxyglucuronate dehydrogenase
MTDLGFAIVGMGVGAKKARATASTPGARLVAVCDLQEEKARALGEELGCDYHTDLGDVLKRDDVDVVGILTPSGTHADLAMEVLEAGKHVFTTKPMDISLPKCDALIEAARKTDRVLAVDFNCRYDGMTRKIAGFIGGGGLGRLILADLQMKWYREQSYYDGGFPTGWRSDVRYEGGSLANQGVHYIDLLMWFAGPVADVYGRSGTLGHEISTEDLTVAMLTFKNGAWGMVETTTCSYPSMGTVIEVTGENGTAVWSRDGGRIQVRDQPDLKLEDLPPVPGPASIIEDMVSAVNRGTEVAVDGAEGRKSVELFTAVYESSRTGRKVALP